MGQFLFVYSFILILIYSLPERTSLIYKASYVHFLFTASFSFLFKIYFQIFSDISRFIYHFMLIILGATVHGFIFMSTNLKLSSTDLFMSRFYWYNIQIYYILLMVVNNTYLCYNYSLFSSDINKFYEISILWLLYDLS